MKRIGLVGGLGPESTLEYYRNIIDAFKGGVTDLNYPEIIVYSVNLSEYLGFMGKRDLLELEENLLQKLQALKRAGAEFAAMTANSPHLVFDRVNAKSPLPLISIIEAACEETFRLGLKKPGLFGTGFTMNSTIYQDVFARKGIEVVIPSGEQKEWIHQKLFTEIELGIFKDETRNALVDMIHKMVNEHHIDSLILGCTEFPLILNGKIYAGIPMLNTTQLHVDAIVKYCRREG
jgi:aspartate racemase